MRPVVPIALACGVLALAGCASEPFNPASAPEPDPAVAELLPTGAYTVTGTMTEGNGRTISKLKGFVDFADSPDGVDCESDITVTAAKRAEESGERFLLPTAVAKVREVRVAGSPSWLQAQPAGETPGEWKSVADPDAPIPLLVFSPAVIASDFSPGIFDGAGSGIVCSIPIIPRFMSVDGDRLVFDRERTETTIAAAAGNRITQFVDALGVDGRARDNLANEIYEVSVPTYEGLTNDTTIRIAAGNKGRFTITQKTKGGATVKLRFTPTKDRPVDPVDAVSYFEQLSADVEQYGLDYVLEREWR